MIDTALIESSGLFDPAWYGSRYPDVPLSGISPLDHFCETGVWLERDPGPGFNSSEYRLTNRSIHPGEIPLLHFLLKEQMGGFRMTPISKVPASRELAEPLHGYIDFPPEGDFVGHDYIRVIGWCYLHGCEIKSVQAELAGTGRMTPLKYGITRGDIVHVYPNLKSYQLGFQGDVFPWSEGGTEMELIITIESREGLTHRMTRRLKIDPTVKGKPANPHLASVWLNQTINDEPIF